MSRKQKLKDRLQQRPAPKDFTWDEAETLMMACGFRLITNSGSSRKFVHTTGIKAILHEPHPGNVLLKYMIDELIEALRRVKEIT